MINVVSFWFALFYPSIQTTKLIGSSYTYWKSNSSQVFPSSSRGKCVKLRCCTSSLVNSLFLPYLWHANYECNQFFPTHTQTHSVESLRLQNALVDWLQIPEEDDVDRRGKTMRAAHHSHLFRECLSKKKRLEKDKLNIYIESIINKQLRWEDEALNLDKAIHQLQKNFNCCLILILYESYISNLWMNL